MPQFKAKFTTAERKAFGNLLRRMMTDKGLTGADLARRANKYIASGKGMDRSAVSWYVNGRSVPTPTTLNAIAKVLDVDPQMLLPRDHAQRPGEAAGPPAMKERDVRMSLLPGGKMHLMINIEVSQPLGWSILKMLEDPTAPPNS